MSKCTMSRGGEREGRARGGCGCWPPCRDPNIDRPGLQEVVTDISAVGQRVNVLDSPLRVSDVGILGWHLILHLLSISLGLLKQPPPLPAPVDLVLVLVVNNLLDRSVHTGVTMSTP